MCERYCAESHPNHETFCGAKETRSPSGHHVHLSHLSNHLQPPGGHVELRVWAGRSVILIHMSDMLSCVISLVCPSIQQAACPVGWPAILYPSVCPSVRLAWQKCWSLTVHEKCSTEFLHIRSAESKTCWLPFSCILEDPYTAVRFLWSRELTANLLTASKKTMLACIRRCINCFGSNLV